MVSNGNTLGIYSNCCSHRHARIFMCVSIRTQLRLLFCAIEHNVLEFNLTADRTTNAGQQIKGSGATRQALWRIGFAWDSIWLIELNCICHATKTNSRERVEFKTKCAAYSAGHGSSDSWLRYAAAFPAGCWMLQKFMHFSSPVCFSLAVWESARSANPIPIPAPRPSLRSDLTCSLSTGHSPPSCCHSFVECINTLA